ncbi:MAG: FKBP-type peptidyl-prolyl cis-trans isomerase, partial [Ktedonobacterales bacterium]
MAGQTGQTGGPPPVDGQPATTPSGLQYIDVAPGTGEEARAGQRVTVHYTGWLTNGPKCDSSRDRNDPFQFALGRGQLIAGCDKGVAGMRFCGKRRIIIPAELVYGDVSYTH